MPEDEKRYWVITLPKCDAIRTFFMNLQEDMVIPVLCTGRVKTPLQNTAKGWRSFGVIRKQYMRRELHDA